MQVSRFKGVTTPEYRQAVSVLKSVSTDAAQVYAEATHEKIRQEFAVLWRIKGRKGGHVCIYRLKGSRQCKCNTVKGGFLTHQPIEIPRGDHLSEWTRDGQTVMILSQPYGLGYEGLQETLKFCEAHDLEVSINTYPSFHYPGSILSLIFTRKGFQLRTI